MDQLDINDDLSNRMVLFRHLTSEEICSDLNESIFRGLLVDFYDTFVEACDFVKQNKDKIASVSCFMKNGELTFEYSFK